MTIATPATRSVQTLASDAADRLVAAAAARAGQTGKPMVISVCDAAGHLLAYRRMDGAPLQAIAISQDKAYTAAGFGISTDQWHEMLKEEPPLAAGAGGIAGFITFGGGYPVRVGGSVVGGIGVSGGHYTEDMACAREALVECGFEV